MPERSKEPPQDGPAAIDQRDLGPLLFEPEEFPVGVMPKPGELFVHGNYPGKVLFKDTRYPGKTFIFAGGFGDHRKTRHKRPASRSRPLSAAGSTEAKETSDPQEFPAGLVPNPSKLFIDGSFRGKVLFNDARYPGKTFVYASGLEHDRRMFSHRHKQKGDKQKGHNKKSDSAGQEKLAVQDVAEPEEFLAGVVPIPADLFVDGNFRSKVLFRDHRYPGKRFIYRSSLQHNRRTQHVPSAQDSQPVVVGNDEESKDEATASDGRNKSVEAVEMPLDSAVKQEADPKTTSDEGVAKSIKEGKVEAQEKQPAEALVEAIVDDKRAVDLEGGANGDEAINKDEAINDNNNPSSDARAHQEAIDSGGDKTVPFQPDGEPPAQPQSTTPFSLKDAGNLQRNFAPQDDSRAATEPQSTSRFSVQSAVSFFRSIASGGTLNEDEQDSKAAADEVVLPTMEQGPKETAHGTLNPYEIWRLMQEAREERYEELRRAVDSAHRRLGLQEVEDLLDGATTTLDDSLDGETPVADQAGMDAVHWAAGTTWAAIEMERIRREYYRERKKLQKALETGDVLPLMERGEDIVADNVGGKPNADPGVENRPAGGHAAVDPNPREGVSLPESCHPGSCGDSLAWKDAPGIAGGQLPDCETLCQGFTGLVLVFFFFRPDLLPNIIKRNCRRFISQQNYDQWWWTRLMLGLLIFFRVAIWGLPEGLFAVRCNLPEMPGRWPQIWYYPDSAWPIFAPKDPNAERERRW